MNGLRARKKARTQDAIIQSATALFNQKGFHDTTVEEIAELAEVGVGTVYNYFGSKRGLLIALGARATEELLESGAGVVESPGDDPEESVAELLGTYLDFAVRFDRQLVRELMASAFMDPDQLGMELARQDYMLIGQVSELLKKLQDAGKIDTDLPVEEASLLLYLVLGVLIIMYAEGMIDSHEALKQTVACHVSLIFRGWRP